MAASSAWCASGAVIAGLEDDGVIGCQPRQRVDVGVGVVAFQIPVLQPQHALLAQFGAQHFAHLHAGQPRVALGQAAPGAQERAAAVGLDGATLQRKVDPFDPRRIQYTARRQPRDQRVIAAGPELSAPAGEAEVEETRRAGRIAQGDRT